MVFKKNQQTFKKGKATSKTAKKRRQASKDPKDNSWKKEESNPIRRGIKTSGSHPHIRMTGVVARESTQMNRGSSQNRQNSSQQYNIQKNRKYSQNSTTTTKTNKSTHSNDTTTTTTTNNGTILLQNQDIILKFSEIQIYEFCLSKLTKLINDFSQESFLQDRIQFLLNSKFILDRILNSSSLIIKSIKIQRISSQNNLIPILEKTISENHKVQSWTFNQLRAYPRPSYFDLESSYNLQVTFYWK